MASSGEPNFIRSLEGLRAIAVLGVVLFHLDVDAAPGGYLGVDFFFVISGFIISRNISREREAGRFQFSRFYERRAMRLLPAAAATTLLTLVAGFFILSPSELLEASRSGVAALFSASNFHFWLQSGYFDASAETKPLLHTWSLGVEEQFYLFWPALFLISLASRRPRLMAGVILTISLFAALFVEPYFPSAVFYLLPFRVFEFMAGSILALLPPVRTNKLSHGCALLGIGGLVAAFALTTPTLGSALPGLAVSVFGALAIASRGAPVVERVLGSKPLVWIGSRSYTIYLAHWPIIVLFKQATGLDLTPYEQALLGAASIGAGAVLSALVERPLRLSVAKPRATLRSASITASLMIVGGAVAGMFGRRADFQVVSR